MIHPSSVGDRWKSLSLFEQLGHVGSEVDRALRARERNDSASVFNAMARGLELLDLTIGDSRWSSQLKELCRVRETLADFFLGDNEYHQTAESWKKYFLAFGMAAAIQAGR